VRKGLRLWVNPLQHNILVWPEHKKSQCDSLLSGVAALQKAVLQECCVVWYGAVEGEVEVVSGGKIRLNRNVFFGEGSLVLPGNLVETRTKIMTA
jgi:hypothetical protein